MGLDQNELYTYKEFVLCSSDNIFHMFMAEFRLTLSYKVMSYNVESYSGVRRRYFKVFLNYLRQAAIVRTSSYTLMDNFFYFFIYMFIEFQIL